MAVFGYLWFMMGPVQEVLGIQYAWYGAKAALAGWAALSLRADQRQAVDAIGAKARAAHRAATTREEQAEFDEFATRRAFRREVLADISIYGDMYRFLPVIAQRLHLIETRIVKDGLNIRQRKIEFAEE